MARPDLTKYFELKKRGLNAHQVAFVVYEDNLSISKAIYIIDNIFDLPFGEVKDICVTTKGYEHHLAFHEELMDILDKINEEGELENQGGIS